MSPQSTQPRRRASSAATRLLLLAALAPATSLALVALVEEPAAADGVTKQQCIDADSSAQDLRRTGKFSAARDHLRQCSDPACPTIIRDDCTQQLDELRKAQPTIVFDLKDGSGHDLVDVTATMDGVPIAHALDGSALTPDPGSHVFVFTSAGQPPVTQTFVIREGEKDRHERVVIGAAPPPPAATSAPSSPMAKTASPGPVPSAPAGMPTQTMIGLVVGGVGIAGLVAGGILGAMAMSAASQQKSDCASPTNCPNPSHAASEHSNGETTATLSTVGFIAGGVLAATGAVLYLTSPRSKEASPDLALAIVPSVAPGGGGLSVSGGF